MSEILKNLFDRAGSFEGFGINHENQKFRGVLTLSPEIEGKGLSLEFTATGDDGTVYHKEHSILGRSPLETLSLWVLSSNHPGVIEHQYFEDKPTPGADKTFSFRCGDLSSTKSFREVITIDLWQNGDVSYRYSWGMPGGEFKERSGVRMLAGKNRPVVPEAKMKQTENGLVPEGEGWYVLNAKEARWHINEHFGESCGFEGDKRFDQYGMNIHAIHPGRPSCHYHGEDDQEDMLIVKGECKLLIEGQERHLKQWDFVHFPKWSRHVCVGTGSEPCIAVMVGGRVGHGVIYPAIDLAKKYGASPDKETDSPKESYANCPKWVEGKAPGTF
jgi:uncharacterized cupin superfamily protein